MYKYISMQCAVILCGDQLHKEVNYSTDGEIYV